MNLLNPIKNIAKKGILMSILLTLSTICLSQELKIEGTYQGKNLFIMNPSAGAGQGFCVSSVEVNGTVTNDQINSNAFEIDLSVYGFKVGEKIKVILKHKAGCKPKLLNPEVLDPKSTFNCTAMKMDAKTNTVNFTTTAESGSLQFIVEQFRWNKWVKVGTVTGKGTAGPNQYQVSVNICSGENQFRVKQNDYTKIPRISKAYKFRSMTPPITYTPQKKITTKISFSDVTMYEIYNPYGALMMKGIGNSVDISSLKKLDKYKYIMLFDNQQIEFNKE